MPELLIKQEVLLWGERGENGAGRGEDGGLGR